MKYNHIGYNRVMAGELYNFERDVEDVNLVKEFNIDEIEEGEIQD
jgi:hypothetical protein